MMHRLYQDGFRHVLFVAKAPYTSTFLNKKEDQKELYFMNEELLTSLLPAEDFRLYPIHYHVKSVHDMRKGNYQKNALFIEDTSDIQKNLYQDHEGLVPILQLYSGNSLPRKNNPFVYHSLITYQTWNRIYKDEVLNNAIQTGLINPEGIKADLIRALLLLHTVRFEADKKNQMTIVVDPYKRLIGNDGVARRSVIEVPWGDRVIKNNQLAYFSYLHSKVFDKKEKV
jgi:hypothetical protein